MAATKTVQVLVIGDSRSAQAALKAVSGQAAVTDSRLAALGTRMQSWGRSMSSAGSMLTRRVTLPIALVGGAMVKLASDAEETRNKVGEIFGGMADEIESWSDTSIERMGLAQTTAQNMASQFGLLFQAAKLPGPEVVGLSEDFTQLAADMASFFNIRAEDALMALRSGLTGEAEPLRRFGVFLNEAATAEEAMKLGIVEAGEALTDQQKVIARTSLIQKGLTTVSGDYARTADSTANRARALTEKFKEMGADLGEKLLPLAEKLLTWATDMLDRFSKLSPGTQEMILKIAGLAAVTGPLLRVFGPFVTLLGKAVPLLLKWSAIKALPMPAAPIGALPTGGGGVPPIVAGTAGAKGGLVGLLNTKAAGAAAGVYGLVRGFQAAGEELDALKAKDPVAFFESIRKGAGIVGIQMPDIFRGFDDSANDALTVMKEVQTQLVAGNITIEEAKVQVQALADEFGMDLPAGIDVFVNSMLSSNELLAEAKGLTARETIAIDAMVTSLDRQELSLSDLQRQQIKNLASSGDFAAIMKILKGRVDEAYEGVKKYNPALDELSDAHIAASKAALAEYRNEKLLGGLYKDNIGPVKNYVRWVDTLEGRLAATAKAAFAAYQNQKLLGGGGGGGGGSGSGGGGHRNRDSRITVEPRRFSRDLDYVRIGSR